MRVLIRMLGPLAERMSAPEVRAWNIALELRRASHDVTVAAPGGKTSAQDGIRLISSGRAEILNFARTVDALIAPRIPPYLYAALANHRALFIADLYNPADVEYAQGRGGLVPWLGLKSIGANDALQLRFADVVLCAVEAQRRRLDSWSTDLTTADSPKPLLRIVPFGIDNKPPNPSARQPIRARFETIAPDDIVVLWWGNVWRWFDAETALRAFETITHENPQAKLVFTGGRPPRPEAGGVDRTDAARELARSMGLLGRSVHFIDDWIPYTERQDYLLEADVGLTLHRDTSEKNVAARGRYMDYLWARLPCLLASGDELSDRFAAQGFATAVPPGDVARTTEALRRLIDDPQARDVAQAAADSLIPEFRWSATVSPLLNALEEVQGRHPVRSEAPRAMYTQVARLYAYRFAGRLAAAARRSSNATND